MPAKDLVMDAGTGQLSHTKIWAHCGYLAMLVAFGWQVYHNAMTTDLFLAFGGIFTGSAVVSKFLSLRYRDQNPRVGSYGPYGPSGYYAPPMTGQNPNPDFSGPR